jgi:hypothetical protein
VLNPKGAIPVTLPVTTEAPGVFIGAGLENPITLPDVN